MIGEPNFMHRFMPSTGACTEVVDLFARRVDASKAGGIHGLADEHEDIKVVVLRFDEAMSWFAPTRSRTARPCSRIYWLAAERERRPTRSGAPIAAADRRALPPSPVDRTRRDA